jgi:hypothetical protein
MALFLRPANVQKNIAAAFTIDLNELAVLPIVPVGYYKNTLNWKEIFVRVKHKTSNQKVTIHFKLPSTTADLLVSDTARAGSWEVDSILIRDYDRGEIVLNKEDIPDQSSFDFFVVSAATHGDLIVENGQEVVLTSNGTKQYGDFIVEAGGTLRLDDGGGILEIEVLGNCVINGQILANNGKHLGGTWNKTSVLGEQLSLTITQKSGGNGGAGEEVSSVQREPSSGDTYIFGTHMWVEGDHINIFWDELQAQQIPLGATQYTIGDTTYYKGAFQDTNGVSSRYALYRIGVVVSEGGIGGATAFGNGGAGGRSAKFIAQAGDDAIDVNAGAGIAQTGAADEHGEDGLDSTAPVNTAGGGFRGAHGQAIYIKAAKIQGSGSINASGQKGGNGGDGGEYLSEGELYANGAGGGGAGGDGGKVWLRAKKGTSALTVNVQGGERGARGFASEGSSEASHGENGSTGSYNFSLF